MDRLHELSDEELQEWAEEKAKVGREKYGDTHLQRYNLVDVMEELIDAINILKLLEDRVEKQLNANIDISEFMNFIRAKNYIDSAAKYVIDLDRQLGDELCTDEKGGERVWWAND